MKYCFRCMNDMADSEEVCPHCGIEQRTYAAPPHILQAGTVVNGRYLIGGLIGEGGFGITYIGLDSLLKYRVAVKEFFPNGMATRNSTVSAEVQTIGSEKSRDFFCKARDNFLREAQVLARFNEEPSVVSVKDFFDANNTVYIVMEYLEGITLKQHLNRKGGRIPWREAVSLLMPVLSALKKIHSEGLIHRDISPDNIMLVKGSVKLLDFGAAREYTDEKSLSVMLKHGYAPFEQYKRHGDQGAWTDIYAFCATLYKCITGETPVQATDRIEEDTLKMPSELGIEVGEVFEDVLRRGLAVRVRERIHTDDELIAGLQAALNDTKIACKRAEPDDDGEVTVAADDYDYESVPTVFMPEIVKQSEPSQGNEKPKAEEPPEKEKKPRNKLNVKPIIIAVGVIALIGSIVFAVKSREDKQIKKDIIYTENKETTTSSSAAATTTTSAAAVTANTDVSTYAVIPVSDGEFEIEQQDGEYVLTKYSGEGGNVVIPDGVTRIGDRVFNECKSLTGITIPDSVKSIETWAFTGCDSLTNVTVPESVTSIGSYAFCGCRSLKNVIVSDNVTYIGANAFFGSNDLTIQCKAGSYAEKYCKENYLTYETGSSAAVTASPAVTTVSPKTATAAETEKPSTSAASKTTAKTTTKSAAKSTTTKSTTTNATTTNAATKPTTTTVTTTKQTAASATVTSISAVKTTTATTASLAAADVEIIDSGKCGDNVSWTLNSAGTLTISGLGNMESYNSDFDSGPEVIVDTPWYEKRKKIKAVVIEDGVKEIGTRSFYNCTKLVSVTIPKSVTSIPKGAFAYCHSLTGITLPDSVTLINEGAFAYCEFLSSINIPKGVTGIGDSAFIDCTRLSCIDIPNGIKGIGEKAFSGCKSLTSITLPDSLTVIGENVFENCTILTIKCKQGSYAEKYAKKYGINYN